MDETSTSPGSYADPAEVEEALALGAEGIQVRTAFAFCEESGMLERYKREVVEKCLKGETHLLNDAFASTCKRLYSIS